MTVQCSGSQCEDGVGRLAGPLAESRIRGLQPAPPEIPATWPDASARPEGVRED